jgi:hypothetical protein
MSGMCITPPDRPALLSPAAPKEQHMDSQAVTPWYLDKGIWVTFIALIFTVLNQKFGWTLNAEEIVGLMMPVVAYIVMHKYKSGRVLVAEIQANAATTAAAPGDAAGKVNAAVSK